jgi:hypothetical protein
MDIVSKINGNTVAAAEFNQIPTELENLITSSGQTVSDAILNQDTIATSRYSANNFYIDSGVADAYVLTLAASMTNPVSSTVGYFIGMTIRFRAGNAGTGGAATVNVNGAGVKNLKEADGTTNPLSIPTNADSEFRYNGTVFVKANDLGTAANYDVGTSSGQIPIVGTQSATTSLAGLSYLPSQITIANNVTDANNDIDFSAGNFIVSDGSAQGVAASIEVKRLDATWAAGTNAGGLAAGLTKTAGTWYDCFKLYNPTTGATGSGFDTSVTASNLLADPAVITAGFTKYKRVNSIQTNSSTNNITPIKQIGNRTYYSGQWYQDISAATTSTSSVVTSLTMPPRPGLIAITQINFIANNDVGSARGLIQNNDFSATLSDTLFNLYAQDITTEIERTNQELEIPTDSSGRVKRIFSGVIGCSFNLWTKGWIDTTL